MKAYLIKFKEVNNRFASHTWKIANSEASAIKFAFGKARRGKEKTMATKRGLIITITDIEEHEVSKTFPISLLPKRESTQKMPNNGDWML